MRRQLEARYGGIGSLAKNGEFQSAVAEALEKKLKCLPELETEQQSATKTPRDLQSIIRNHQPGSDEDTADKLDLIDLYFKPKEDTIPLQEFDILANFAASRLVNQHWHDISAMESSFAFAHIHDSFFSDTDFTNGEMEKSQWKKTAFEACNFSEVDCVRAQFTDCYLSNCEFHNANLSQATFQKCEFNHCNFTGAQEWDQAKFRNCTFNDCTLPKEMLEQLQVKGGNSVNDPILAFEATELAPGELLGPTVDIVDAVTPRIKDLLGEARKQSGEELEEGNPPRPQVGKAEIIHLQLPGRGKGPNK